MKLAVVFEGDKKQSKSIVVDSITELDVIIATSTNLHQIQLEILWTRFGTSTLKTTYCIALDWYISKNVIYMVERSKKMGYRANVVIKRSNMESNI